MQRPIDAYPEQIEPATTEEFPHGKARNDIVENDKKGTPFVDSLINENWGFFQALVKEADITPSGNVETALESDLLNALKIVIAAAIPEASDGFETGDTIESSGSSASLIARGFLELTEAGGSFTSADHLALASFLGSSYPAPANSTGLPPTRPRLFPTYSHSGLLTSYTPGLPSPGGSTINIRGLAIDPIERDVFAIHDGIPNNALFRQAGGTGAFTQMDLPGASSLDAIAIDYVRKRILVISKDDSQLRRYDYDGIERGFWTEPTGKDISHVAVNVTDGSVVVSSGVDVNLYLRNLDDGTDWQTLPVPTGVSGVAHGIAIDPEDGSIIATTTQTVRIHRPVSAVNGDRIYDVEFATGNPPTADVIGGVAFDPVTKNIWVCTNHLTGSKVYEYVVDLSAGAGSIAVPVERTAITNGNPATGIAYQPLTGAVVTSHGEELGNGSDPGLLRELSGTQASPGIKSYIKT